MGFPVTIVAAGGMPVTYSALGTPAAETALGVPVTIVSSGGLPLAFAADYAVESLQLFSQWQIQPSATRKGHADTFIKALKTAGIFPDKLDFLYVLASHDEQSACLNWVAPTVGAMVPTNAPTFAANQGYTGDAVSKHLITSLTWATLTKLTLNSAHLGTWISGGTDAAADRYAIGATGSTTYSLRPRAASGNMSAFISSGTSTLGASSTIIGHSIASRRASGEVEGYKNGASNGTNTTASTTKTGGQITLLRTSSTYANFQLKCAHAGSGLSDTEASDFYNALNTYLTAIAA